MSPDRRALQRLAGLARPYLPQLVRATMAMLVVAAASSVVPLLIEPVMDDIFVARRGDMLWPLAAGIVLLFGVKALASYAQGYWMGRVGHRIVADLRARLLHGLLRQDVAFFATRPSGEIVSRLTFDTTQIQEATTRAMTGVFQHTLTIVGLTIVVFWQNPRLAIVAVLVFPVAVYPLHRFGRAVRRLSRSGQEQMGLLSALLYETVGGIRVVKLFGAERQIELRVGEEIERLYDTQRQNVRVREASSPLMEWIGALGVAAVIMIGGRQVIGGQVTTGQFFSFLAATMLLYDPVRAMNGTWQQIQQGLAAAERIFAWLDTVPRIASPGDGGHHPAGVGSGIRLSGVRYRYRPEGPDVLDGIDLDVPRGRVVAIVGPSGGGKSTLVDLLARFDDPGAGTIAIDGVDLRDMNLDALRRLLAMVDQRTVLFDDTVRNNIRLGRPAADDDAVIAAAHAAHADEFVRALPQGYDTPIGENGVQLSGGQRQRLAIARALLRDAPILVLDEATSALDAAAEREVQAALDELLAGRTAIVIAHRLSTIRGADEIVVVDRGRIVERGSHAALMATDGMYRRLHDMQHAAEAKA